MLNQLGQYRQYAPTIARVLVGFIFLLHGLQKFGLYGGGNLEGVVGFFGSIGIPAPELMAPFVALVETLGGLALILGLGTRVAAALLIVIMLVAMFLVKIPNSPGPLVGPGGQGAGYELDLALLAGLVVLLLQGPGAASLDERVMKYRPT